MTLSYTSFSGGATPGSSTAYHGGTTPGSSTEYSGGGTPKISPWADKGSRDILVYSLIDLILI